MQTMTRNKINAAVKSTVKLTTVALLASQVSIAQAAYWDASIGGFSSSANGKAPGENFIASASVCAQRNSDADIPIRFYFSSNAQFDSADKFLGSTTGHIQAQGSFCSPNVNKTVTMPTATLGSCFNPNPGYILFKAGDDVKASSFAPKGGNTLPTVESFEPSAGHPGSVIHIKGQNFDITNTAVYIGGVEAARKIDANGDLYALVPEGATSNKITLKKVGPGYEYCAGSASQSASNFTVTPAPNYCVSGAMYSGYSKIDRVASKDFNHDVSSSPACEGYAPNTDAITTTSQGTAAEAFNVQFGTCGAPDYSKLFKMYVDWNNDEDFNDPGEFVVSAPGVLADTLYSLNLPIPATASVGTTRMRLITALYYTGTIDTADDIQACGQYPFGETQDYALDITSSNGLLTASSKALNLEFGHNPLNAEPTKHLINNPKRQDIKVKQNFIDQSIQDLPPVEFTYPSARKQ